jgi:lipoprotein-anchoring transpeptidase ErfK/SrfK
MNRVSRRSTYFLAGLLAAVLVLALAMYLYDRGRREDIAKGVRIDGIDVGGTSAAAARTKLQRELGSALLGRPVVVRSGTRTWSIDGRQADLTVDVNGMVDEAVSVSRQGSIFSRTARGLLGESVNRNIPLQATYSHQAVRDLTAQVRSAVDRPAVDATVQPSGGALVSVPDHPGVRVNSAELGARVETALTAAATDPTVAVPTRAVRPAVTTTQLAARYPAYIVVDRAGFTLRYYSHLKLALSYPIAVGMQGLETPPGLYHIQWKQVDPPWYVPNSAWAGALAGKTIPPGPEDPLKARFMSFDGGAGIHGIDPSEYGTIGHDASHGCVRMRIPDVIALYSRTPVGTPVYIV